MNLSWVKRLASGRALLVFPFILAIANAQPTVAINEYPVSGSGAGPITSGSDGALWFPVSQQGVTSTVSIIRSTTAGVITSYSPSPNAFGIAGITAGPDGALWFTAGNAAIVRVTTSGVFTQLPLPVSTAPLSAITAGPDGALWI